jgi:hypothetical protein
LIEAIMTSVPTAVVGLAVVVGTPLIAVLGLLAVRRMVSIETLEAHQDVAGFVYAAVGVVYAVLLGLVVIAVWGDFEEARGIEEREGNALHGLYRLAPVLPPASRAGLRESVRGYTRLVIEDEWATMARGRESARTQEAFDRLWLGFLEVEPASQREVAAYQEALTRLNDLGDARRSRLLASRRTLPVVLWTALLGGAAATTGFTYFFGVRRLPAQALMTATLGAIIGLALFVILAMDLPYTGDAGIGPEAFREALATFDRVGD